MPAIEKERTSSLGYSFPFEGEKHLATIVLLPYRKDTWRKDALPALDAFYQVVDTIRHHERVVVGIDPSIDYHTVRRFQLKNVTILRTPYDDSWARDNTPIFLRKDKELLGVDFGFNAWGGSFDGLYQDYRKDNALSRNLLLELRIPRLSKKDFILEGGSILSDGRGTLLTTEECLLSKGRNPSLSKEEITRVLKDTLQVANVLFLPYGLYADETDGHVDNIASFLSPDTIALSVTEDKDDPQYGRSLEDRKVLEGAKDVSGNPYHILELPLPEPLYLTKEEEEGLVPNDSAIHRTEGRRLAASYANLYQGEDFVLVPQFGVKEDKKALDILASFYEGKKKVYPILSREILLGGGNIHCITKEIPYSENYPIEPEETK